MELAKGIRLAAYSVVFLALSASARADYITGYGWVTTNAIGELSTGASLPTLSLDTCSHGTAACTPGNADVSFTTTGIDFPFQTSGSIEGWLASSGFQLNNLIDSAPDTALSPTIWEFVGHVSVTNGETFSFAHDDGMTLTVNGLTLIDSAGPTSYAGGDAIYTGDTEAYAPFTLVYVDTRGGDAVLGVNLFQPDAAGVPEPASLPLMGAGTGAGLIAFLLRRRIKTSAKQVA